MADERNWKNQSVHKSKSQRLLMIEMGPISLMYIMKERPFLCGYCVPLTE
jgi:hypothetical protein